MIGMVTVFTIVLSFALSRLVTWQLNDGVSLIYEALLFGEISISGAIVTVVFMVLILVIPYILAEQGKSLINEYLFR